MKILKMLAIVMCLILAYSLRMDKYDLIPTPGQSLDEYSYSWVGMSLIGLGKPVGISGIKGYDVNKLKYVNVDRIYQKSTGMGTPLTINYPWFDHPPLMGIITGGFAYMKGARVFEEASVFLIRKPMIYLGVLSVFMVIMIGWLIWGFKYGLVSGIIYASSPLVVIGSRMIQAENGLIPFMLMSILLALLYEKYSRWQFLWLSALTAGIATLFKVSSVFIFLALILWLWGEKDQIKRKVTLTVYTVIYLSIASLFVIYGLIIDKDTFIKVFLANTNRFYGIGFDAWFNLLTETKLTGNKFLTDAWPLSGILAVMTLTANKISRNEKLLVAVLVSFLAVYLLFGSESYGWYTFPVLPILILFIGGLFKTAWQKVNKIIFLVLALMLPVGVNMAKLVTISEFGKNIGWWKWGWFAGLVLLAWMIFHPKNNSKTIYLLRFLMILVVLLSIYLNIRVLGLMTVDYWYKVI